MKCNACEKKLQTQKLAVIASIKQATSIFFLPLQRGESRRWRDPLDPLPSREGKIKVVDYGKEVGVKGNIEVDEGDVAISGKAWFL
jgi:hypothetical protein